MCRPILFYLVIGYENTDSQSAVKGKEAVTTVFRNIRAVPSVKENPDFPPTDYSEDNNILIINTIFI
ncbi:MAG TPA: hypothetical protein DDX86_08995 [Akkermansia sp.]|nr:hypothetical protein [Akkermansia sp.]